jgi:hypothetical protein
MRLVEVVEDTTMLVSGYEHQTWECSGCSGVEQRMTFSRKKSQIHKAPFRPAEMGSVETAQMPAVEPVQTEPVETAPIVPIQATQIPAVEPSQTAPVEATVAIEATNVPETPKANTAQIRAVTPQTSALPKSIEERLRYLTKRTTALREAAAKDKRRAEFNRDWDTIGSLRSPSGSSRPKDHNEPTRSLAAPVTAQPPARDEPTTPEPARGWNWRRLLRLG